MFNQVKSLAKGLAGEVPVGKEELDGDGKKKREITWLGPGGASQSDKSLVKKYSASPLSSGADKGGSTKTSGSLGKGSTWSGGLKEWVGIAAGGVAVSIAAVYAAVQVSKMIWGRDYTSGEMFELLEEHEQKRKLVESLLMDRNDIARARISTTKFPGTKGESKAVHEYWQIAQELKKAQVALRELQTKMAVKGIDTDGLNAVASDVVERQGEDAMLLRKITRLAATG